MAKYDWNTFRNYVAFLASEMDSGTMHPHHDSELNSWYHDAFLPWDHYLNNIVLFYHDSPITRSHFMDPTDRAIKGFYCILSCVTLKFDGWLWKTIGPIFYATSSFVHHFKSIGEIKLQLQSGNAQLGSKLVIFCPAWPWNLMDDLKKQ